MDASVLNQLLRVERNQNRAHVRSLGIAVDFPHSWRARNSLLRDVWEWQEFLEAEGVDRNRASVTWTPALHPDLSQKALKSWVKERKIVLGKSVAVLMDAM